MKSERVLKERISKGVESLTEGKLRAIPQQTLEEIVRRIVEVAHPIRLILFGSAARGEMDSDSDIDILVIVESITGRGKLTEKIYRNLHGLPPIDIVVVTEEEVLKYREKVGTVLRPALREGVVVYET